MSLERKATPLYRASRNKSECDDRLLQLGAAGFTAARANVIAVLVRQTRSGSHAPSRAAA